MGILAKKSSSLNIDKLLENEHIVNTEIRHEIKNSMLSYSMLVILSRAIPNVLDGLKPVQRRILYSCLEQKHDWNKPYVKCAKISGEVMGNYHPHSSCYGTIVNMSQDWDFRYPLIDFHGCNGSISGDAPAADRYTEGRLHKIAYTLLEDVMDKCSVDFRPNYSETATEPLVLPALLPNFLLNGANGIAVGMTTNCPSHNLNEVCDAIIYALRNKDFTLKELLRYIKGPDMPLGACISSENLEELYRTGKAKITYRANYEIETNHENNNPQIVFTDITPNMKVDKTLEKIYELITTKVLVKTLAVRDESQDNIRIVIECAKTANLSFIINKLYEKTDLQKVVSYIMYGILDDTPQIITLEKYIQVYIDNRRQVLQRRMKHLVNEERKKLEINEGIAKVMDKAKVMSKEIIDCEDDKEALTLLMEKYQLSELQATYILDKKIRSLVKKNVEAIHNLINTLKENIKEHTLILQDEQARDDFIIKELIALKSEFGDTRRTKIVKQFQEMKEEDNEAFIDAVVVQTSTGIKVYDKQEFDSTKLRDKNALFKCYFDCKIHDEVYVLFKSGEISTIKVKDIENAKLKDVVSIYPQNLNKVILTVLKNGNVKKTAIEKLKPGKMLIKAMESEIVLNKLIDDIPEEVITLATHDGYISRFSVNSFTATGLGAKAMPASKLEPGDYVVDCEVSLDDKDDKLLILTNNTDGTYSYKVVDITNTLVKGRIARALKYVFDKKFSHLIKINIGSEVSFFDNKNNVVVLKKYDHKLRIDKGDTLKYVPNTFNCICLN